jgi:hypothetical protein
MAYPSSAAVRWPGGVSLNPALVAPVGRLIA